jgi:hypothetical protein
VAYVQWVLDSCLVRGASARLVLVALADRADEAGVCWPGVADVARRAGLAERQTKRLLRELEAAGQLITIGGGRGPRDTVTYIIVGGRSEETIRELSGKLQRRSRRKGVVQGRKGDTGDTHKGDIQGKKGDTGDTRTISEPSEITINRTISAEANLPTRGVADAAGYDLNRILRKLKIQRAEWSKADGPMRRTLILAGCGCDGSFRQFLSKSNIDLRVLLELADEYCRRDGAIRNPGGWFRQQLRKRGVLAATV